MPSFLDVLARPSDAARLPDPSSDAADRLRAEAQPERKEKNNDNGCKVEFNDQGLVSKLTRANGTVIDCVYTGKVLTQINETPKGGKTVEWKKDANEDRWRSMSYIGAQRIKFTANDRGETSFEDVSGTRYLTHGDGSQTRTRDDGSQIEIDKNWHVTSVSRADGTKLNCKHNGAALSEVEEVRNGQSVVWTYDAAKQQWDSKQSPEIRKHLSVSDLGNYAYISARNDDVVHIDYADGISRSFEWHNGAVTKIVEQNRAGRMEWQREGTTDTFVSGALKVERKQVAVALNGDFSYVDKAGYKHIHKFDVTEEVILPNDMARSKAVQDARDELMKAVDKALPAHEVQHFTADLDKLERRAHATGLKETQVVAAMGELAKILGSTVSKPFVTQERVKLAEEALRHVANPRGIDQGFHDTCGAASAQVFVCSKYPEKFVALVREVADSGQFKTTSGLTVKPPEGSLRPDREAGTYKVYDTNAWGRSYASQLYQVIGINAAYQAAGSTWRYEQRRSEDPKDTGERRINTADNTVHKFSGLYDNEVRQISRQTCGKEVQVMRRGTTYNTVDEMRAHIAYLQKQGDLPGVLWVSTKNEPFWTATGRGRGGGVPGGHYVTVWDIDNTGKVLIDNQWGRRSDYESLRRLTIQEAHTATNP